jgi:hypothetical protein
MRSVSRTDDEEKCQDIVLALLYNGRRRSQDEVRSVVVDRGQKRLALSLP